MGQSNEGENPSLILESLQNKTLEDENNTSLEKSFHIIRIILSDYKFYKSIISNNKKNKENNIVPKNTKKSSKNINIKEYSKEELMNMDKNNYDKHIFNDVEHKIERIKKWVKMSKYSGSGNKKSNVSEIIFDNDIKKESKKKLKLSNYVDLKIESGIFRFYQNKSSKFIQRVKKGPPDCFRWCSWCILNFLPQDRNNLIYENYINMNLEKENKDRIIRDIERTFSQQKKNKNELRIMETSLYKVLKAFWNLDKVVGYCQGMNLVVGFMLIISDFNERDSFYLLCSLFSNTFKQRKKYEYNIRGLFYDEFPLLNLLNYIFENLLDEFCPDLKEHLEILGITTDLWMGRWFHTLFTLVLPINWCKRIWDNIFAENIFFLVKFGICFSIMLKDDIIKMEEEVEILDYLKNYEKYSLCFDNEELNKKFELNKILEKSRKININIELFLKNYEKINPSFTNKLNEINDIKYEFHTQLVKKDSLTTILFSEEDNTKGSLNKDFRNNSIKLEKSEEKEILINTSNKDNKINNKNKRSKIPINLKNSFSKKNDEINKNISKNSSHLISQISNEKNSKENIIENIEKISSEKKEKDIENDDNINNMINNEEKIEINNTNQTYNSLNRENEENIECEQTYENIIKKNINTHKFENFLNRNRLDYFSQKKFFKTFEKNENTYISFFRERKETLGLHRPNKNDISIFCGINKFKNSKKIKDNKDK